MESIHESVQVHVTVIVSVCVRGTMVSGVQAEERTARADQPVEDLAHGIGGKALDGAMHQLHGELARQGLDRRRAKSSAGVVSSAAATRVITANVTFARRPSMRCQYAGVTSASSAACACVSPSARRRDRIAVASLRRRASGVDAVGFGGMRGRLRRSGARGQAGGVSKIDRPRKETLAKR